MNEEPVLSFNLSNNGFFKDLEEFGVYFQERIRKFGVKPVRKYYDKIDFLFWSIADSGDDDEFEDYESWEKEWLHMMDKWVQYIQSVLSMIRHYFQGEIIIIYELPHELMNYNAVVSYNQENSKFYKKIMRVMSHYSDREELIEIANMFMKTISGFSLCQKRTYTNMIYKLQKCQIYSQRLISFVSNYQLKK